MREREREGGGEIEREGEVKREIVRERGESKIQTEIENTTTKIDRCSKEDKALRGYINRRKDRTAIQCDTCL